MSGRTLVRLLPALSQMALTFYLSHRPAVAIGASDKLVHFVWFGGMAVLVLYGLSGLMRYRLAWSLSLVLTALYGASDEWHQSFVPGRSPELADALADAAGALIALASYEVLRRRLAGRQPAP